MLNQVTLPSLDTILFLGFLSLLIFALATGLLWFVVSAPIPQNGQSLRKRFAQQNDTRARRAMLGGMITTIAFWALCYFLG